MFKLFNRFAWTISLALGYAAVALIGALSDIEEEMFDTDSFLPILFFTYILGSVIKAMFLSAGFIREQLEESEPSLSREESAAKEAPDLTEAPVFENPVYLKQDGTLPGEAQEKTIGRKEGLPPMQAIAEALKNAKSAREKVMGTSRKEISGPQTATVLPTAREEYKELEKTEPGFIARFFAENVLAKLGGILLFLGVMFLLQLVYTAIGPIGKMMIGFFVGFSVFIVGLLVERKKHIQEARILFGTSILINYLVILSGRYLISDSMFSDVKILNESITFFLLILNTVFAVAASLAFNSHALLFFSFVIAYLNPFLIGARPTYDPYTIVGYALAVSSGAIILSLFYRAKYRAYSIGLLYAAFIGGNLLILAAPFDSVNEWLVKLSALAILSLAAVFAAYRSNYPGLISQMFFGAYAFFALLVGVGNSALGPIFTGAFVMAGYSLFLALMVFSSLAFLSTAAIVSFFYLLVLPLVIILGMLFGHIIHISDLAFILVGTMILYLAIAIRYFDRIPLFLRYIFFACLGLFIIPISLYIGSMHHVAAKGAVGESAVQYYGIYIAAMLFFASAYAMSRRQSLEYLYSLGTLLAVFMVLPAIERTGELRIASIAVILVIATASLIWPFVSASIFKSRAWNLVSGLAVSVLFAIGELYYFLYGAEGQSKMTLGLSFLALAALYFLLSAAYYSKIRNFLQSAGEEDRSSLSGEMRNAVYGFLGISVSLLSLSVAYIFSDHSVVVSAIWVFEAMVLMFFYRTSGDVKIYAAGIILMIIGLVKLGSLLSSVETGEYTMIIPLSILFSSLAVGLKFLDTKKDQVRLPHDILHVLGMVIIILLFMDTIPEYQYGWGLLAGSAVSLVFGLLYSNVYSAKIKYFYLLYLSMFCIQQIGNIGNIVNVLDVKNLEALIGLQYFATVLTCANVYFFNRFFTGRDDNTASDKTILIPLLNIGLFLYLFVVTTQYIYYLLGENTFVMTIYWAIIAFGLLNYGIKKDAIKYRTIGLYVLMLVTAKVLLYDIWTGLQDAIMRVIALMVVGGLMIFISILYSRKYGGHLKGEFDLENIYKSSFFP